MLVKTPMTGISLSALGKSTEQTCLQSSYLFGIWRIRYSAHVIFAFSNILFWAAVRLILCIVFPFVVSYLYYDRFVRKRKFLHRKTAIAFYRSSSVLYVNNKQYVLLYLSPICIDNQSSSVLLSDFPLSYITTYFSVRSVSRSLSASVYSVFQYGSWSVSYTHLTLPTKLEV